MKRYEGFIPAAFTPFSSDGSLHLSPITEMARLFVEQQAPAVFVCGTTGESHSCTTLERMQVAEAWMRAAPAGLDVIVHVGHNCQRDSIELAAHARKIKAAAVAALAPSYFKPAGVEELIEFLRPVAAAAGDLGFYYYDIPSMTGVNLPADQIATRAAAEFPNFAGLKFTNGDLMRLQNCLATVPSKNQQVLFGSDEILLPTLPLGIRGAVGSTYNYAAPIYRNVLEHFDRGLMADAARWQLQSVRIVEVLMAHGGLRTGKAIMSLIGIDCGPVRPPLRPVGSDERSEIVKKLARIEGFSRPIRV